MPKTLLELVNDGLKVIGDPIISSFTSTNILQQHIIEGVNDGIVALSATMDFDWLLKRAVFASTAQITTGSVSITTGSATVTSVDSDGNAATGFGSISAGMYFRRQGDTISYLVSSVATGASPHTLVLEIGYSGSFATAVSYRAFQDTYSLSGVADLDSIRHIVYEQPHGVIPSLDEGSKRNVVEFVGMGEILAQSEGDLHSNNSGVPAFACRLSNDASENPRLLFWPYTTTRKIFNVWYSEKFSAISATSSYAFAQDAPNVAYVALSNRAKAEACLWDKQVEENRYWLAAFQEAKRLLIQRENRETRKSGMNVATYRQRPGGRYPGRSGYWFDHKGARR